MISILRHYIQPLNDLFIEFRIKNDEVIEFEYDGIDYAMSIFEDTVQIIVFKIITIEDYNIHHFYRIANKHNIMSEFTKIVLVKHEVCAITRFFVHANSNPHFRYEFGSYLERIKKVIARFMAEIDHELYELKY